MHGCPQASSGKVSYTSASTASIGNMMMPPKDNKLRPKVSEVFGVGYCMYFVFNIL